MVNIANIVCKVEIKKKYWKCPSETDQDATDQMTLPTLLLITKILILLPAFYLIMWLMKSPKSFPKIVISKIDFISIPAFYLIMWLMAPPKNFEKIAILKKWQLVFFWLLRCWNLLRCNTHKMMHFQAWKNWFSKILPCCSYCSH